MSPLPLSFSAPPHLLSIVPLISLSIRTILSLYCVIPLILVFWNGKNTERDEDKKKFGRYSFEKGLSCLHATQKEGRVKAKEKSV
jgi:hypothetical protein